MPTQITPPSPPIPGRAGATGINSRDATPLSITALAIIAILTLVLHVASTDALNRPHVDPDAAAPTCPADARPAQLSLPYD